MTTADSREVYVEVRHVAERAAEEALRSLRVDVMERFDDADFDEIDDDTFLDLPALGTFRFGDRVRRALFTKQDKPSYAVIYDPRDRCSTS